MELAGYTKNDIPSKRSFSRRIEKLDQYEKQSRRHGKYIARKKLKSAGPQIETSYPLQYVQADGTPLDVLIVDDNGELLGRGYLTALLDVHTRCVLAMTATLIPFCTATILMALKQAYTGSFSGKGGTIENLIVDNGPDYTSKSTQIFCENLGTTIDYSQPFKPQRKGEIERFFRTLNSQLTHNLPGTTFSNPDDKGDYDSKRLAVATMTQLNELLHKWTTQDYHRTIHSSTSRAPELLWSDYSNILPPKVHIKEDIDILARLRVQRVINKGRVKYENLRWHSPVLAQIEHIHKEKYQKPQVTVLIDPLNLEKVLVENPLTPHTYIQANSIQPAYTQNLSLFEHREIGERVKKQKDADREKFSESYLARVRHELHMEIMNMSTNRTKKIVSRMQEEQRLKDSKDAQNVVKHLKGFLEDQQGRDFTSMTFDIGEDSIEIDKL